MKTALTIIINIILRIILNYIKQKILNFKYKVYNLWRKTVSYFRINYILEQFFFCEIFFTFFALKSKTLYYLVLVVSMFIYIVILSLVSKAIEAAQKETTVIIEKSANIDTVLTFLPTLLFPTALFVNEYFAITQQIWAYMLTIATSYVWFFFSELAFCYFTCATIYHLVMVGWHKHFYTWGVINAFFIFWLYSMPDFLPNSGFANFVSNFIYMKGRYIFIAWSGISYLTGWLWYRKYIQKAFSYYNNIPYSISLGNLTFMLLLELYFGIFNFQNWPFIWISYPVVILWLVINGFANFKTEMLDTSTNKFYRQQHAELVKKFIAAYNSKIWDKIYFYWKKQILYFWRKMSLLYCIWLSHYIFFCFSQPLTSFIYWKSIVSVCLIFFYFLLILALWLIYFSTGLKPCLGGKKICLSKTQRRMLFFLPCAFIWITALSFFFWYWSISFSYFWLCYFLVFYLKLWVYFKYLLR